MFHCWLVVRIQQLVAAPPRQNSDVLFWSGSIAVIRVPGSPPSLALPIRTVQVPSLEKCSCAKTACGDSALMDGLELGLIAWRLDRPCSIPRWEGLAHLASKACAAPNRSSTSAMQGEMQRVAGDEWQISITRLLAARSSAQIIRQFFELWR